MLLAALGVVSSKPPAHNFLHRRYKSNTIFSSLSFIAPLNSTIIILGAQGTHVGATLRRRSRADKDKQPLRSLDTSQAFGLSYELKNHIGVVGKGNRSCSGSRFLQTNNDSGRRRRRRTKKGDALRSFLHFPPPGQKGRQCKRQAGQDR